MSELIAIPLESDRRAVEVLNALRWLQAEYACREDALPPVQSEADEAVRRADAAAARRRWVRLLIALAALAALVLSATAAGAELFSRGAAPDAERDGAIVLRLVAGAGALLVAVALPLLRRRGARYPRPAPERGQTVTWLVSYLIRDPAARRAQAVRATVLQITLPAEAEGRLKAILARVDATAAR
jgi:hypothetical protein